MSDKSIDNFKHLEALNGCSPEGYSNMSYPGSAAGPAGEPIRVRLAKAIERREDELRELRALREAIEMTPSGYAMVARFELTQRFR